ncbi:MAG: hypothetical protein HY606_06950 [Planctomycetes bacterium]|nr:hypothetical protein [Planctomycetota bacterium]
MVNKGTYTIDLGQQKNTYNDTSGGGYAVEELEDPDYFCVRGGVCVGMPNWDVHFGVGGLSYTSERQEGNPKDIGNSRIHYAGGEIPGNVTGGEVIYDLEGVEYSFPIIDNGTNGRVLKSPTDVYRRSLYGTHRGYARAEIQYKTKYVVPSESPVSFGGKPEVALDSPHALTLPDTMWTSMSPEVSEELIFQNEKVAQGLGSFSLIDYLDVEKSILYSRL